MWHASQREDIEKGDSCWLLNPWQCSQVIIDMKFEKWLSQRRSYLLASDKFLDTNDNSKVLFISGSLNAKTPATMVRKLKFHEQKLLRKVDFTTYAGDNDHREAAVIRRYVLTKYSWKTFCTTQSYSIEPRKHQLTQGQLCHFQAFRLCKI